MPNRFRVASWALFACASISLLAAPSAFGIAKLELVNINAPNQGLNDPTPVAPMGGNLGTTIGQQRRIALRAAAAIWGLRVNSNVAIRIEVGFLPLSCSTEFVELGLQAFLSVSENFPGAALANTWYPIDLANKLFGRRINTGQDDFFAIFNSRFGTDPKCFPTRSWYYGLDGKAGPNQDDLILAALHEFGHGLGFGTLDLPEDGTEFMGHPDIFSTFVLDTTIGKTWDQMTDAERKASAINTRKVVWNGPHVTAGVPGVLRLGTPFLTIHFPAAIAGDYFIAPSRFGPRFELFAPNWTSPGVTAEVVLANDGVGLTSDACNPLRNTAQVHGRIALVDGANCSFDVKIENAENAGAIAVIIVNDKPSTTDLPGIPPNEIKLLQAPDLPAGRISLEDGKRIKAALAAGLNVNATVGLNMAIRAGADASGRALLYAPNPVNASSISHWDPIAFPDQHMEPFINVDVPHSVDLPEDLTASLLRDIGW